MGVKVDKADDFTNVLKDCNYNYHFCKRPGDFRVDGNLLLWDNQMFSLFNEISILSQPMIDISLDDLSKGCNAENLANYYLRGNVGTFVILKMNNNPSQLIIFATCHLHYHKDRGDLRLRQVCSISSNLFFYFYIFFFENIWVALHKKKKLITSCDFAK